MYLNGKPLLPALENSASGNGTHGGCDPNQTVLECAKQYASKWTVADSAKTDVRTLTAPGTCHTGNIGLADDCFVTLPYMAEFTTCSLSQPVLHQVAGSGSFCNSGGPKCDLQLSFETVTTDTTSEGYSIGASISADAEIGVFSTSLEVSTDYDKDWSTSKSTTTSSSIGYTLRAGDTCDPTTVQFKSVCKAHAHSAIDPVALGLPAQDARDLAHVGMQGNDPNAYLIHLCNPDLNTKQNLGNYYKYDIVGSNFGAFCNQVYNTTTATMDVDQDSAPWILQGCMF